MRLIGRVIGVSLPVEGEVELEDVDAGLAEDAEAAAVGVVRDQLADPREREAAHGGDAVRLDAARWPARCAGRRPRPRSSTASTGTCAGVRPGS